MAHAYGHDESAYPDQLRHDIDSGRTGDKVAFPDPAAVPLGADEEAAGTPVSGQAAAAARRIETARPLALARSDRACAWMATALVVIAAILIAAGILR